MEKIYRALKWLKWFNGFIKLQFTLRSLIDGGGGGEGG